jgi:ectoine hydroxylase
VKAGIFLTDVLEPDDGAFEVVPGSHRDRASRPTDTDSKDRLPLMVTAGSVVLFDSRLWHRRSDNVGRTTRKAVFCAYTYRWIAQRDDPFDSWPDRHLLSPLRRQLVGDRSWDAFYPAPGVLPLDEWIESRRVPMTAGVRSGAQLLLG